MNVFAKGGDSGAGSRNKLADFKGEILNNFLETHDIKSVIEYGCGDGIQLRLATYRSYLGFDVSPDALARCRQRFRSDKSKHFKLMKDYDCEKADLTLSLDVIYHLVEDSVFKSHVKRLFSSSDRFVIVYSSNTDEPDMVPVPHVKHRNFTRWIEKNIRDWKLIQHIPNRYRYTGNINEGSFAEFYIYEKVFA